MDAQVSYIKHLFQTARMFHELWNIYSSAVDSESLEPMQSLKGFSDLTLKHCISLHPQQSEKSA